MPLLVQISRRGRVESISKQDARWPGDEKTVGWTPEEASGQLPLPHVGLLVRRSEWTAWAADRSN